MKRKLFQMTFAAVTVSVMMACGSKSGSNNVASADQAALSVEVGDEEEEEDEDAPKTEEGVIAMLRAAYEEVNLFTNPCDEDECEGNFDLVAEFCSKEFNDIRERIREAEVEKGITDGIIDDWNGIWSFWEEGTITPTEFDVDLEGDTGDVTFTLSNGEDSVIYCVSVVYEDGQWRVSDWTQRGLDGLSLLDRMMEYLEELQQ